MSLRCFRCGTRMKGNTSHYATLFGGHLAKDEHNQTVVLAATGRPYCDKCWQEMISIYKAFRLMEETGELKIDESEVGKAMRQ